MTVNPQREKVVEIAMQWLRTPYRHAAKVKGHGADCLTLIAGVFEEADLIEKTAIPYYSSEWHLHKSQELYLQGILRYAKEIPESEVDRGDIVLWKFGHCYSHGAIIIDYPIIIHAAMNANVTLDNLETSIWLNDLGKNKKREKKFFSYWK